MGYPGMEGFTVPVQPIADQVFLVGLTVVVIWLYRP